jgi:hypothetical protein
MPEESCYYERVGEHRFAPTEHVGGAWRDDEQHFSPLGGLIAHALDCHLASRPPDGMLLGRLSFDILGQIPRDVCDVEVTTLRPGRTIELLGATVSIGGRPIVLARAWRLGAVETTQVAGHALAGLPSPERCPTRDLTEKWRGGFIRSLEVRMASAPEPGRARGWVGSPVSVVGGEPVSEQTRFLALVDTANGIAVRRDPTQWMFPNVDLSIHLFRSPTGAWTGLDTTVSWGPGGLGVTSTVLHDLAGPVGYAQQSLTLRPLPRT